MLVKRIGPLLAVDPLSHSCVEVYCQLKRDKTAKDGEKNGITKLSRTLSYRWNPTANRGTLDEGVLDVYSKNPTR